MAVVTRHHNCQSRTRREMEIPRFLPTCLRNQILGYLYFVRPFVVMLQRASEMEVSAQEALIWGDSDNGATSWNGNKLCMLLSRYSEKIIGFKFTLRNYRQIAIKIDQDVIRSPRHLRSEDDFAGEDDSDNEFKFMISRLHIHQGLQSYIMESTSTKWWKRINHSGNNTGLSARNGIVS